MKNKAQFFSLDLIFATLIFIVVLIAIYSYWEYPAEKTSLEKQRSEMEIISRNALSTLLTTQGIPANWSSLNTSNFNESNVKSIGIAKSTSMNNLDTSIKNKAGSFSTGALIIDNAKMNSLKELNATKYSAIKNIMGIIGNNYEFELSIYKWNSSGYELNTTIGITPEDNATETVSLNRYAMLDSEWAHINFKVWQKCTGQKC